MRNEDHGKAPSDEQLARLLAGKPGPSVLAKEKVFAHVADAVAPRRSKRAWLWALLPLAGAAAASVVLLAGVPEGGDGFTARGGRQAAQAILRPTCVGAGFAPTPCVPGGRLTFELAPPAGYTHVALFAVAPDGALTWYWPAPTGHSLPVEPALQTLPESILLQGHAAGIHSVYAVFSRKPLTRAAIEGTLGPDLAGSEGIEIIERQLRIE